MKALLHAAVAAQCLALLVWVGGMVFFAFAAAPLTFQPEVQEITGGTHVPGTIVSSLLQRFAKWELVCAVVLIAALIEQIRQAKVHTGRRWGLLLVAAAMTALMLWYGWVIGPRMRDLRAEIGDFNTIHPANPSYVEFDLLHRRYVRLMGTNMILGLGLFIASVVMIPSAFRDRDRGRLTSVEI